MDSRSWYSEPMQTFIVAVTVFYTSVVAIAEPSVAANSCGTILTHEVASRTTAMVQSGMWDKAREFLRSRGDVQLAWVPMSIHIVRYTDGSGGIAQSVIEEAISDLNFHIESTGLVFFQLGISAYIDSDEMADFSLEEDAEALLSLSNPVSGSVNVWFVPEYEDCGVASFSWSDPQGIVMRNDCTPAGDNHSTFSHEVGHYFDLFHTHETYYGTECVDGSNCSTTGDLICDTEADPDLYFLVDVDCQYTGDAVDVCGSGVPYNPPTYNLMSYSRKSCRDHFSPEQLSVFASTAHNTRENHLRYFDFDGDGEVGSYEIGLIVLNWNTVDVSSDANRDGIVNVFDLLAVLEFWGDYL